MKRLLFPIGLLALLSACVATDSGLVREQSLAQGKCTLHGDSLQTVACYRFNGATKPVPIPYLVKIHREFPNAIPIDCRKARTAEYQLAVKERVCDMCESSVQARMASYGE